MGLLISSSATAQPSSGSHWSLFAEWFPCLFSDLSHYSGPAPLLLSSVLPWVVLIKSYPGPDLWIYFMAWPQTCHIIMNSPDNLDPLLTKAANSWAPAAYLPWPGWALGFALPISYFAQLLDLFHLRNNQSSLYPERSIQSTVTTVVFPNDSVPITGELKLSMLYCRHYFNLIST